MKLLKSIHVQHMITPMLIIFLTQFIQKLYPVIDNHYIGLLGSQALLIHNIYYSFFSIAQYTSFAAVLTCMIAWGTASNETEKSAIFSLLILLTLVCTMICVLPFVFTLNFTISHFNVSSEYKESSKFYLYLGFFNIIIMSFILFILGFFNGIKKQNNSFLCSAIILIIIVTIDYYSTRNYKNIIFSLNLIMITKVLAFLLISFIFYYFINKIKFTLSFKMINKNIYKIWFSELSSGVISAIYPIVFSYQLAAADKVNSLVITYQLILQLTSIICLPLSASIQKNLVAGSSVNGVIHKQDWWKNLIITGLIPTEILLILFAIFNKSTLFHLYHYTAPTSHEIYIILFFIATMIGQVGNATYTILRARKKSHLVTISYYVSDIVFLLGITQLFILFNAASPSTIGIATIIYALVYTSLSFVFIKRKLHD